MPRAPDPVVTRQPSVESQPECVVAAEASAETGVAPLEVQFTAEGMCTDAAGTFTWTFGDGSEPSRVQNPTHVYTRPGSYTARVTLADDEHHAGDSDEALITVRAP